MKPKIKVEFLGHLPHSIDITKITEWKSELFDVVPSHSQLTITTKADLDYWAFSDNNIENLLSENDNDISITITSVPLQDNYYARRFSNNRVCVTFFEIASFLQYENIPLENFILRVMYAASLIYKRYQSTIPPSVQFTNFTHDETKGCVFDMNGIKGDIIYSTNKPQLCPSCIQSLTDHRVDKNLIDKVNNELNKIQKPLYYRISDLIKDHPIWAILLSSLAAILLGAIGSLLASVLWEKL